MPEHRLQRTREAYRVPQPETRSAGKGQQMYTRVTVMSRWWGCLCGFTSDDTATFHGHACVLQRARRSRAI